MKKILSTRVLVKICVLTTILLVLIIYTIWGNSALMVSMVNISSDRIPETNCQGLFNQIHKKGARSTVWLLTPRLTDYIFPFSRSLQRYA